MTIRQKLTYQFAAIVATILLFSFISIYLFSALHRKHEYYVRLKDKAVSTAQFIIDQDEVDTTILKIIDRKNLGTLFAEKVLIYNDLDQEVYSTDEDNTIQVSPDILAQVRLRGEVQFTRGNFEVIGVPYVDQFNRFVVFTAAYDKYGVSKMRNLRIILVVVFFACILIVLVSGHIYAGKALRPMARVVDQVRKISARNLHVRVEEGTTPDEISQLARTFNSMLTRLETAFEQQKRFVSNASHELRNPLTVIRSQLEVLLLKERTPNAYQRTVTSVLEDTKSLSHILNRLIALAQVSVEEAQLQRIRLRIDDLLWQCREELIRQHPKYRVDLVMEALPEDEEQLYLSADGPMLKMAFLNLMENACKFSNDHRVTVGLQVDEKQVVLQFIDRGIGIAEEDLPKILEPFYRSPRAASIRGQGLGLSIVDRIVDLHKARLTISSKLAEGTTVEVVFPTSKEILSLVLDSHVKRLM